MRKTYKLKKSNLSNSLKLLEPNAVQNKKLIHQSMQVVRSLQSSESLPVIAAIPEGSRRINTPPHVVDKDMSSFAMGGSKFENDVRPSSSEKKSKVVVEKELYRTALRCGACKQCEATFWCSKCYSVFCKPCWDTVHRETRRVKCIQRGIEQVDKHQMIASYLSFKALQPNGSTENKCLAMRSDSSSKMSMVEEYKKKRIVRNSKDRKEFIPTIGQIKLKALSMVKPSSDVARIRKQCGKVSENINLIEDEKPKVLFRNYNEAAKVYLQRGYPIAE